LVAQGYGRNFYNDYRTVEVLPVDPRSGRGPGQGAGRIVTVRDGVQLAVRDQGPIRAEATVVLLHGSCLERKDHGQARSVT